jgi:DNA ligase-1
MRTDILTKQQKLGVKYYENMYDNHGSEKRIPRRDIDEYNLLLNDIINVPFEITGSYRRGLPTSGDIDILCKTLDLNTIVKKLQSANLIGEHLSNGKKKWMGFGKVSGENRRIDILACPANEYAFSVLYFTGSAEFNIGLRMIAKKKGFILNEHGLFTIKDKQRMTQEFNTERAIFKFLNVPYVLPSNRTSKSIAMIQNQNQNQKQIAVNQKQKQIAVNQNQIAVIQKQTPVFNVSRGVMLCETYKENSINPVGWFMSQKYDGIRSIWDGQNLRTRENNIINAPEWFIRYLPSTTPLDGELIGPSFQSTVSIVRKKVPVDSEWKKIVYVLFDIPTTDSKGFSFEQRQKELTNVVKAAAAKTNRIMYALVKQYKITSKNHMESFYQGVLKSKGEGIVIRRNGSMYQQKRSKDMLKLKPVSDTEATIANIIEGKGKYVGKLGALLVDKNGLKFKIGSGFDNKSRSNLWTQNTIGKTVTYSYRDVTNSGKPRFPAFMRIRNNQI